MGTPNVSGATAQSGYNEKFFKDLNARLQNIEQLLELDTRFAGLNIPGQIAALRNGGLSPGLAANTETLTASGAASIAKLITKLDGTTNASAVTLAAPAADGQLKLFELATSAAHSPTLDGTNVQGQAGKAATFGALGDSLVLLSLGGAWVILGGSVSWA